MAGKQGPIEESAQPGHDAVAELLRGRRSIDEYHPECPPREVVLEALETARWAPNHHLTEPWRFYLLGPETRRAVIDLNAELVAASQGEEAGRAKHRRWSAVPGWLVVACNRCNDELQAREDYAACACAVQNLMLSLWSRGVGSKWTTGAVTRHPRFHDLLWIDPEVEQVVALLWYGYPSKVPDAQRRALASCMVELP